MILDKGICTIYSVTNSAGAGNKPVDVLTKKYQSWYGELDFSSDPVYVTEFREDVETTARIRVHQSRSISTRDMLKFESDSSVKYEITRVYHANDDDNGQPISDIILREDQLMWEILDKIKTLILTADASALRYFGRGSGNYTVWAEYELDGLHGGDSYGEYKWRVLIERFTSVQDDSVAIALMTALEKATDVTFQYSLRRDNDQELIYHAWDCEVC